MLHRSIGGHGAPAFKRSRAVPRFAAQVPRGFASLQAASGALSVVSGAGHGRGRGIAWPRTARGRGRPVLRRRSFPDVVTAPALPGDVSVCYAVFMLDARECQAAMLRRDPRYDGAFFVAVTTTGIYCRPVCPARTPKCENVRFFPSAAAAENAGFRPCLRCRPETAPFCPAWIGSKSTVHRALRLIETGALDHHTVEALAGRLGIGPRHLNRLFARHLQATPAEIARTRRIQRARTLLRETPMSIAEIAGAAGFSSARRMSAAFTSLYGAPPSRMRRPAAHTRGQRNND